MADILQSHPEIGGNVIVIGLHNPDLVSDVLGKEALCEIFKNKKTHKSGLEVWDPSVPVLTFQQTHNNIVHVSHKCVARARAGQPAID